MAPITYVYDGDSVYGHSTEGRKLHMTLQMLIDRLMPLRPSATAHPGAGSHDAEAHAHDTAGQTPVLYRIVLREKTGRFEKR